MENYKYYFKKIVKSLANDYKLSKSTERFLNLLMIECARKIIEKANQLLHPVDYETQKIQKFYCAQRQKDKQKIKLRLFFIIILTNVSCNKQLISPLIKVSVWRMRESMST